MDVKTILERLDTIERRAAEGADKQQILAAVDNLRRDIEIDCLREGVELVEV